MRVVHKKRNCKFIIGISLIDMANTNFVTNLTMLFSEYVLCLLVEFSGFLLDLAFQGFVVNIHLYLFYCTKSPHTGINVSYHIRSISISRYFDIFPNSPDDKFLSIGNISPTSKQELLLCF